MRHHPCHSRNCRRRSTHGWAWDRLTAWLWPDTIDGGATSGKRRPGLRRLYRFVHFCLVPHGEAYSTRTGTVPPMLVPTFSLRWRIGVLTALSIAAAGLTAAVGAYFVNQ